MTAQVANFAAPARTFQLDQNATTPNAFRQCISECWRRIRERNELSKLSDRDLADFMCNKADPRAETGKWFWEP